MFIFNLFKKKKNHPSDKISLDKIWNMWENDSVPSPYRELMTYQAEVNNGGHMQFLRRDFLGPVFFFAYGNANIVDKLTENFKTNCQYANYRFCTIK